jgi:CarD family transcriptional regulator
MQFSVGDKVMHPRHGPGEVTDLAHRELVEGFEHYYVIKSLTDKRVIYVPVRMADELGLRPIMSQALLARVLFTLAGVPQRLSQDFQVRQERIREKLATARPLKVAEAVRDLTHRRRQEYLTMVDQRLLDRARDFLVSEIAVITGTDALEATGRIDTALRYDGASQKKASDEELMGRSA